MFKLYIKQCYLIGTINYITIRTKNRRTMLYSKCLVCNSKNLKFLKEQEARGLLSKLTRVKIPVPSDFLKLNTLFWKYEINAMVNRILLGWEKLCQKCI